ncbi:MAG: hypothetical protein ACRC2R_09995 [Xenococcaceae cyanobacterium]
MIDDRDRLNILNQEAYSIIRLAKLNASFATTSDRAIKKCF